MPVTNPKKRRIVHAAEVVEDAITKAHLAKPETITPARTLNLTYEQRIERQIEMVALSLNKYERRLRGGLDLTPEEERVFISLQDSLRKLEVTLLQLTRKDTLDDTSDIDLALSMVDKGIAVEDILKVLNHDPQLPEALLEALEAREEADAK